MKREVLLNELSQQNREFDLLVIGGGATGLGVAVDAASRGYKAVLIEQDDFAKGTSSRSTKLVHGGVRYLAQGDVQLVIGALHERGRMRKNAPHLVKDMRFIIGNYRWWEKAFYTIGLTLYDLLAGRYSIGRSLPLSKTATKKEIHGLKKTGLRGGVVYHDGQFDDARMAITLAQTAVDHGAVCLNYIRAESLLKNDDGRVSGAVGKDIFTGHIYKIHARVTVNATGVFVDDILRMDVPGAKSKVRPSQGVHLVVDKKFLGGNSALMIPKTKDGRVLFGVPWHDKVVLGTTDTPLEEASLEPRALNEEVDFILEQAGQYLESSPGRSDILSVFAGLRPLAAPTDGDTKKTKEISRNHKIYKSASGLLTITGGKWTTYREMAEDVVDQAIRIGGLEHRKCITGNLRVHGYTEKVNGQPWNYVYGSDAEKIIALIDSNSELGTPLHKDYPFLAAHVIWAVKEEQAFTVEDVLARRLRVLFLDARAAMQMAPAVASLMAGELNKSAEWEEQQVNEFISVANGYIIN